MTRRVLVAAIASLTLLAAGCGGSDDEAAEPVVEEATEAAVEVTEEAPEEATDEATDEATAGAGGSTVLIGTVGTPEDPEAFEIALTDEAGEPVTELPAGTYTIQVSDPSTMHNFHLMGGSVDETTSVPELEETTFEVTLEAGEYTYVCDPHPPMTGSFTVT